MAARSTDELVPDLAGAFWLIEVDAQVDAQGDAGLDEQIPSTGRLEKSGEIISIGGSRSSGAGSAETRNRPPSARLLLVTQQSFGGVGEVRCDWR